MCSSQYSQEPIGLTHETNYSRAKSRGLRTSFFIQTKTHSFSKHEVRTTNTRSFEPILTEWPYVIKFIFRKNCNYESIFLLLQYERTFLFSRTSRKRYKRANKMDSARIQQTIFTFMQSITLAICR